MSGFENNVINAINALIRAAIHSPNYVAGVSGWSINKDGSAEFNNLTIRGTFMGTNFVLNQNGLFMYDPTETLGNLVVSITAKAVTGPLGETVPPGITIGKAADVQMELLRDPSFATGILKFLLNNAGFSNPVISSAVVVSASTFAAIDFQGPNSTVVGFRDRLRMQANSSDGVSSFANIQIVYSSDAGVDSTYESIDGAGVGIFACKALTATMPGTGTSQANPATSETWHDLRPLVNNFVGSVAGAYPPQYRKLADGNVQIVGTVKTPTAAQLPNPNGTTWGTLPAGWRPLSNDGYYFPVHLTTNQTPVGTPVVQIHADGTLTFQNLPTTYNALNIHIDAIFPLDNTGTILV